MFKAVLEDFSTIDCAVNMNLCAYDIESVRFRKFLRERLKTFHKPENLTFEILEDEFMIFMRDTSDVDLITEKANAVLKEMEKHNQDKVRMLIHNDYINQDMLINASYLASYKGKERLLVTGDEVTNVIKQGKIKR